MSLARRDLRDAFYITGIVLLALIGPISLVSLAGLVFTPMGPTRTAVACVLATLLMPPLPAWLLGRYTWSQVRFATISWTAGSLAWAAFVTLMFLEDSGLVGLVWLPLLPLLGGILFFVIATLGRALRRRASMPE